jgi:ferritin-like metal-binding protein YciE
MNDEQKTLVLRWLNDAYAMEQGIVRTLENHAKDAQGNSALSKLIHDHIETSQRQAEHVERAIERLGGDISQLKSAGSQALNVMKELPMAFAGDELIKNALADFATEHFEIASYTSLMTAADLMGDQELVTMCRDIIAEEQAMADALRSAIPIITRDELSSRS